MAAAAVGAMEAAMAGASVRVATTAVTYVVSLAVIGVVALGIVLVVAGPHAGLLPSWLEPVVGALGWAVIFVLPVWLARKVWLRMAPESG